MKVTFKFPILHESCEKCDARFMCLTDKIHKEFDISYGGSSYAMVQPYRFGLACFKVEPYRYVTSMRLDLLPDKKSMSLDFIVNWI